MPTCPVAPAGDLRDAVERGLRFAEERSSETFSRSKRRGMSPFSWVRQRVKEMLDLDGLVAERGQSASSWARAEGGRRPVR
jgi:ribosomal protein RSM22 (predicted rRNA methylase)